MQKFCFFAILITLGAWMGNRDAMAVDPTYFPTAADNLTTSTPAPEPSSSSTSSPQPATAEAGETPKLYTITAELREVYDDNIFTTSSNQVASFETAILPSILFTVPMENSEFDARLSFGATYYDNDPSDNLQCTADFLARFTHQFSDRFAIDVRNETGYFMEPGVFSGVGTLFRDGGYISQNFSSDFTAQWTPLLSTVTSFSNTAVFYDNSTIATGQDYVENNVTQSFGFAILPKYTLTFSGIYDGISYNDVGRGYDSYTGTTGINWAVLPTLTASLSIGASYTQAYQAADSTSPYGTVGLAWQLGKRSNLSFNYSYSIVPTDVTSASGQLASRIYTNFTYDISRSLSSHLNLALTYGDYTDSLVQPGTTGSFTEWDTGLDVGLTYHVTSNCDANFGYTYTDVSSQLSYRNYTRDQFYIGIRGIY